MEGYCKFRIHLLINKAERYRYVGAEDGIYEYHVNVGGRKIFPSIVFR